MQNNLYQTKNKIDLTNINRDLKQLAVLKISTNKKTI